MPRARKWTDEQFIEAVRSSISIREACIKVGLSVKARYTASFHRHARRLGLDVSHLVGRSSVRPRKWTDDQLREAVRTSVTIRQALIKLGLAGRGENYRTFRRSVERLGLDCGHFLGCAHRRGGPAFNQTSRIPIEEILVEHSTFAGDLVGRLVREGFLRWKCHGEGCGITTWLGTPIRLQLDHINGIRTDNRLENLRFLCPNCHSLTLTYCGRNSRRNRLERESGSHA